MFASSPAMDTSYGSHNNSVFGQNLTNTEEQEAQRGPILFGNKRRSLAVSRTPSFMTAANPVAGLSSPSTDIFSSPAAQSAIPSHMKDSATGSGKSVHWSPALVSDKNLSSPLVKPHQQGLSTISNAPPLRSLRDEAEPVKKTARRSLSTTVNHTLNQSAHSAIASQQQETTISSPRSASADNWVTVFGFTPDQVFSVLQFFSRHGEVVQHQVPPKGNWMHIGYSCGIHARQALARNGAILDGCTRIGVIPCTEKELTNGDTPLSAMNRSSVMEQSIREEPDMEDSMPSVTADHNGSILDNSLNSSRISSRAGMRSLSSYRARTDPKADDPVKQDTFMNKLWNAVGF